MIIMDIDNFKHINDGYGHMAGDKVIRSVASAIGHTIRSVDMAGRYGGDEFLILLPGMDLKGCEVVAERIRRAVQAHGEIEGIAVTISLGIAAYETGTANDLVRTADARLYTAKHRGRNITVAD